MNEKLSKLILNFLQEAMDKKYGEVTFYIADGKIVDVDLGRKANRQELIDAQKN